MPRKITYDENKVIELYNQGKTDSQIAKEIGIGPAAVFHCRKRLKLQSQSIDYRNGQAYGSKHNFHNVLTPKQSKEMESFLKYLLWAGDKAVKVGAKLDVMGFIDEWRGSRTTEEWKQEKLWRYRKEA